MGRHSGRIHPRTMSHTHSERLEPGAWKIIAVAILGPFMSNMDSTVVNVSLSFIKQELHSSIASAQWVVSGYLLALALMLPLNAWLVARLGAKRLYLICFSSFTPASFLCGGGAPHAPVNRRETHSRNGRRPPRPVDPVDGRACCRKAVRQGFRLCRCAG